MSDFKFALGIRVAAALESGFELFLTFDERQGKVAKAAGFSVKF